MKYFEEINLDDFDYLLPKERIADYPIEQRDKSKLLVAFASGKEIEHRHFNNIYEYIPQSSLLAVNSTKVIEARLAVRKATGGLAEILLTDPVLPAKDPQITMSAIGTASWNCIIGGRHIKPCDKLFPIDSSLDFVAEIINKTDNGALVKFTWDNDLTFADIIKKAGKIPLPPYIKREAEVSDSIRYQTVYADKDGSVAAPTAGLHFSDSVLKSIADKNIKQCELVLHVGPGTFKPIERDVNSHEMHSERIFVLKTSIIALANEFAKTKGSFVTATGTTSLRTLETLYWSGVKIILKGWNNTLRDDFLIDQFDPYKLMERTRQITAEEAFGALAAEMIKNEVNVFTGKTKLFIVPGYKINTAKALITNYHTPKSTLLLLVAAFIGNDIRKNIYSCAMDMDYRFLSYGDSSLLIRDI